ncbi:hypothetical protein [Streptomyces sp. NPDC058657]|uniref:hypothetical protein n=1 Tax=unclassified Streptomyces TaxID=2593676 RepID=UPI00364BD900
MMNDLAMAAVAAPLRALNVLAAQYPNLPAGDIEITEIYPDRLKMAFHDALGAFEAWRDALEIAPEDVDHGTQSGGSMLRLTASISYAGAEVQLVGFAEVPTCYTARTEAVA